MHRWYILRSPSANATELGELMQSKGLRVFVPTEYRAMTIGQDKVWQLVPSRPDLLFVYGTYDNIHNIIKNTTTQFVHQSEVIQHLPLTAPDTPITVPEEDMDNLIRLVNVGMPQSYSVTDAEIHYRPGSPVRIIDGPFKGVIGRVARIHTQTRVVVTIPGIISYATTYIPKHQMEPLTLSSQLPAPYHLYPPYTLSSLNDKLSTSFCIPN